MTWLYRLFHRSNKEEELEKELSFHLDLHTSDLIVQGYSSEEARRQDWWLLSDEVYEDYVYRGEHVYARALAAERTPNRPWVRARVRMGTPIRTAAPVLIEVRKLPVRTVLIQVAPIPNPQRVRKGVERTGSPAHDADRFSLPACA